MKKFLSRSLLALIALSLSMNVVMPRKADAMIIPIAASGYTLTPFGVVMCVIFLPICIFDEKTDGNINAVSKTDLVANGYSDAEIAQIMHDQTVVQSQLAKSGMAVQVGPSDTKASLSAEIRSLVPEVSDTYLDFLTSSAALK